MKTQTSQNSQKKSTVAIITMFFLFAMIAFVTNLAAPVGTIWKSHYEWTGMLGNLMNFLAYLFMGIPAGMMLEKIGYKKTTLWALGIGFFGLLLQYISSIVSGEGYTALIIYLLGAFIGGFCVCILNTVVNPMLNSIGGGGNRGNQLIQTGSSFNSLAGTLTPLFVGMLIGRVTPETSMSMVTPLLLIGMAIFLITFFIIWSLNLYEPKQTSGGSSKNDRYSPWSFRHTVLGVIGIFLYVGMEVGIPAILIFYLSDPIASGIEKNGAAIGGAVAAIYWLLMLVGRFTSSFISGKVSSRTQLMVVSLVGILLVLVAIFTGDSSRLIIPAYSVEEGFTTADVPVAALFLVLCGLCTSVMWGAIFNLAVEGLGKYTAKASGLFMTMVVGGGILPFFMEMIAGNSYLPSYWIVIAVLIYLFFYAVAGSKNVNKNIPTDDTTPDALNL